MVFLNIISITIHSVKGINQRDQRDVYFLFHVFIFTKMCFPVFKITSKSVINVYLLSHIISIYNFIFCCFHLCVPILSLIYMMHIFSLSTDTFYLHFILWKIDRETYHPVPYRKDQPLLFNWWAFIVGHEILCHF